MPSKSQCVRARMMVLLNHGEEVIAAATGLRRATILSAAGFVADLPVDVPLVAVKWITGSAQVHRRAHRGEFGKLYGKQGQYTVDREGLKRYCAAKLAEGAETLARYMLFCGHKPDLVQSATGLPQRKVLDTLCKLDLSGCGPKSKGPYSTAQAAKVLNIIERRARALCQDGRLGQRVGGRYVVTREDLVRFGALERRAPRLAEDDAPKPKRKKRKRAA